MAPSDMIVTPTTDKAPFNFGPVSKRDDVVFTCERPGGDPGEGSQLNLEEAMKTWIPFMQQGKDVQAVLVLLEDDELAQYEGGNLIDAYQKHGLQVFHKSLKSSESYAFIMEVLDSCYVMNRRIVVHCTHGMGRSGRVAAGWLIHKYGLTPEQATLDVLATATAHGVTRMGSVTELQKWMNR